MSKCLDIPASKSVATLTAAVPIPTKGNVTLFVKVDPTVVIAVPKAVILSPAPAELLEKVCNCCCADLIPELKLLASKLNTAVIAPASV